MLVNKPRKNIISAMVYGTIIVCLAGCQSVKETLDFSPQAPDEFLVVTHAPLEMPPDLKLRPPAPGQPRPQEYSTDTLAKQAVLGPETKIVAKNQGVSKGEAVLLKKTGGSDASGSIRAQIDKETAELSEDELPGIDKLKQMVGKKVEPHAKVVDPVAEVQRIKANKAAGKPVTAGETPTLKE